MIIGLCVTGGFLAGINPGLLGLDGGLTVIPVLNYVLPLAGIPQNGVMHAALATSLATMIVNTSNSALRHYCAS